MYHLVELPVSYHPVEHPVSCHPVVLPGGNLLFPEDLLRGCRLSWDAARRAARVSFPSPPEDGRTGIVQPVRLTVLP